MSTKTKAAHYFGGFLTAILVPTIPILSILITLVFLLYELDEKWAISDEAFVDIREYLIGMVIGAIWLFFVLVVA